MTVDRTYEKPSLSVYIGMDGESYQNFLFLDLVLGEYEITMPDCTRDVDDVSGGEFADSLDDILRKARRFAGQLNVPVRIDTEEIMEFMVENEFSSEEVTRIKSLVREFREEVL